MSMASISEDRPDVAHYPGGEGLYRLRHSAAHVLATAVTELFPDVKVAGGPPIENGFYYEFARDQGFTPEDLEKIEARMREIIAADQPFEYEETSRDEAQKRFEKAGEKYKLHFLSVIPAGAKVTYYKNDGFVDFNFANFSSSAPCRNLEPNRHARPIRSANSAGAASPSTA